MFLWCPFHLDAPFSGYQAIIHCFVLKSVVTADNLNVGIGKLNAHLMCSNLKYQLRRIGCRLVRFFVYRVLSVSSTLTCSSKYNDVSYGGM
jgi:hypothetical protein